MAYSFVTYTGNGATTQFAVPFGYIRREHIQVSLNGTVTTAFTWVNDGTIQMNTAPANAVVVKVLRITPVSASLVDFTDGSTPVAKDFDTANTQNLYTNQELRDISDSTDALSTQALTTANTALSNSSTAISTANGAVTTANAASTAASNAVSTANTANANASAAVSTANAASTAAGNAVTTANTASAAAINAVNASSAATTTANAAASDAATAISTANTALTTANSATATANSASTAASNAVSTANTAASNASAAVTTANTAATNASAAVSTANTASTNASAAVTTANAAQADATNAVNTANTAASNASTALSTANAATATANTAASNASTALSTANTAATNASAAVTTANTANTKADQAIAAVGSSVLYELVANVAAIPGSPANNKAIEVYDSTGIEGFTPLAGLPVGFTGSSGLSARIIYSSAGSTWNWVQYFPNDPETRYLKIAAASSTYLTTANASSTYAPLVHGHPYAPLASPTFTGTPAVPTAAVDTDTTQAASTAYVIGQGYLKSASAASTYQTIAGMSSYLTTANAASTYAPINNPTFTGAATTPSVVLDAGSGVLGRIASAGLVDSVTNDGVGIRAQADSAPVLIGTMVSSAAHPIAGFFTTGLILRNSKEIRFLDADASHYVGFKPPAVVTTSQVWQLPAADGTNGQALTTDGSGVLSWTTTTPADGSITTSKLANGAVTPAKLDRAYASEAFAFFCSAF